MHITNTYDGTMVMLEKDDWRVEAYPELVNTVADRYRGTPLAHLRYIAAVQPGFQGYTGQADMMDLNRLQLLFVLAEIMDWDWFDRTAP